MPSSDQQRAVLLQLPENKPIDIEFKNITFTVSMGYRREKKQILKGVSGKFLSGELTAIMGPSGAGKSSLLNILTGFHNSGMSGTITTSKYENEEGSSTYRKERSYILQDDRLAPLFTVQEAMTMAADLKLGTSISLKAKQFLIDDILDTLGLLEHADTRCERLSGGQRKRLSVALELIDNPPVIFLDEPTTGLDSLSSAQCIRMLKSLARGGRTIVCTIHQPSASLFELFDHVYVLAEGQCVYQGSSLNAVPYLSSVGLHCPQYHNPADYLLEVANGDYGNFTSVLAQSAKAASACWRNIPEESKVNSNITNSYQITEDNNLEIHKAMVLVSTPSEWHKFKVLINRSITHMYRDWTVTHLKVLLHLLVGIILGLTYLNAGNDGSKTFTNIGYLLITSVYLSYTSMMPAILRFPSEMPLLKKERFNNWYCLKTYYIAYLIVDIPLQILFCTVYASVSYVMSAQPLDLTRFMMFLGACILVNLTAESVGIALGTTVNPINGTFLGAILIAVMILFAGFLVLLSHMPRIFYYLSYLSFLRHGLQALVASMYGNNRETLPCPEDVLYCHYRSPKTVLEEFDMVNVDYWTNFIVLCGFIVVLRILGFFTLRHKLKSY